MVSLSHRPRRGPPRPRPRAHAPTCDHARAERSAVLPTAHVVVLVEMAIKYNKSEQKVSAMHVYCVPPQIRPDTRSPTKWHGRRGESQGPGMDDRRLSWARAVAVKCH